MKTVVRFLLVIFVFVVCFVLFPSCFIKPTEQTIALPAQEMVLPSAAEWAVVTEPYTPFYTETSVSSGIVSHARMGDIIEVTGKKISDDKLLWYCFEKGWIPQTALSVYSNKLKAEKAAVSLN